MKNTRFESLDITNDVYSSFERLEEWTEFYVKILEKWEELSKKYLDVSFHIDTDHYSDYGDSYYDTSYCFHYERILSEEELSKEQSEKLKKEEQDRVFSELCGKLSTNSIGAIVQNDDLRKLYLNGQIKI